MASSSRSRIMEGLPRVIDGGVNPANFPPLREESRGLPGPSSSSMAPPGFAMHGPSLSLNGGSRAPPSPLHGGSRVSPGVVVPGDSSLHGGSRVLPIPSHGASGGSTAAVFSSMPASSTSGTSAQSNPSSTTGTSAIASDAAPASDSGGFSSGASSS